MSNDSTKAYVEYLTEKELEKSGVKKNLVDPMVFDKDSPYSNSPEKKSLVQPMVFDVPTKSFEDKLYILLIVTEDNDGLFDGNFKICTGRTECYRHIQTLVESFGDDINIHESMVITETKQTESDTGNKKYYLINYSESLSIYAFCKSVESYYSNDPFKIDDYFAPPDANAIYKGKFEDSSSPYAAVEDPIMAKIIAESIQERNNVVKNNTQTNIQSLYKKNDAPFDAKKEFPMLFDDGNGVNV